MSETKLPDWKIPSKHAMEVLWQMFRNGPTWDGNVISKTARDELKTLGYIDRLHGWQFLTREGMHMALIADYDVRKDKEDRKLR